ncbi:hypothetical protein NC652_007324 [Populus alba x Populus x berolinensis]|nr:hypothetical protein NC652_007324 [Populus alba x Populus x berolinensis]
MPDHNNRQVKSNAVSNQSADNIEEAFWRLKIHDPQEQGGMAQSSPYPDRPGVQDCGYYLRTGLCGYGSNCRFNHPIYAAQGTQLREELPERIGQPDCGVNSSLPCLLKRSSLPSELHFIDDHGKFPKKKRIGLLTYAYRISLLSFFSCLLSW